MQTTLSMYARYGERADSAIVRIFDGLGLEIRNADRGAYYGSLHGLIGHVLGGTLYFHSLFRASHPGAFPASERIAALASSEGSLDEAGWERMKLDLDEADRASVELAASLDDRGFSLPVKVDWYGGTPAEVPLHFLFNQMAVHGIHHRGQISQLLDELKVDHDFSGIDLEFLG